ncbi:MAG: ATP-dependent RNA helicase RhlE [Leptolyngbya sp.]|jgi:ATP-dependent RNA helicase RhlE|uniref:RNA helicase n=1 Tax=Shackletoniella antarctica TaxID=268115 RepID=A0A2W4WFN8_9CYAN|nr:MAG: ATP-dependent RNA helicase RhlE [Shackletoniella antarctica]PZV20615.1 MAG: ATP-dependent RNA helicase RhlE [Leptolyngbya sp.]
MTFEQLGLEAGLLRAVSDQGYTEPTPIQQKAIPAILQGQDILASAQTGTGKTAGFTLPLLQRLAENKTSGKRIPRALVLTPTRELAAQVGESVITYGKHMPFKIAMVYGGVSFGGQARQLRQGIDILIATPGRLLDHVSQGTVDLSAVEILVLDECDRMLDMGFIHDIRKIMGRLPDERQTLMFSATFSKPIQQLAHTLLKSPVQIDVAPRNITADRVEQVVHPVDRHRKRELLSHIIGFHNWQQVLVFTRTKHGANRLAEQLAKDGLKTAAIHGNKTQAARARALKDFKQGRVRVLVATDVASRGIDIDQLPYVVNFELPNVPEDYVHRIGRTGRAGNEGRAISLISDDEMPLLVSIERMLKQPLTQDVVAGYEPSFSSDTSAVKSAAAPGKPRRQRPRRSGGSTSAPRRSGASARG